jgi:hypothetical protein
VTLQGAVAKGPFILGTNVSVSPVDASGNTTGTQYTTQTSDNAGDFSVMFTYSGPVMLSASGYYYNEMAGALSTSTLTLNGMAAITSSGSQNAYINLLSDIAFNRIKTLMGNGATLAAAVTQADTELYGQLTMAGPSFNPGADATQLNLLGGNNAPAAYLFSASAVVEEAAALSNISGGTDAKVQSMINTLGADFATGGTFTSSDNTSLQSAVVCVEPDGVMASLQSRFTSIGSSAVVPNINLALDSDGDGIVNATDTCVLIANATQSTIPNGVCNYQFVEPPAAPSSSGQCIQTNNNGASTVVGDFDGVHGNDMFSLGCTDAYVWLNTGADSFATPVALGIETTLGVTGSDQLSMGFLTSIDMNHDGKLDIFFQESISSSGQPVQPPSFVYLPGDGTGHFGSPVTVWAPPSCSAGGSTCTANGQCCSNFCNTHMFPDGGITGTCQGGGTSSGYTQAVVADLNGDSVPDVAAIGGNGSGWTLTTFLSASGAWTASAPVSLPSTGTTYFVEGIAAGNLRNGSQVDLAIPTQGAGLYLLAGNGTGAYSAPGSAYMGFGSSVLNIGITDVDVDGHPDLIGTAYGSTSTLDIIWGDGSLAPAGSPYAVNITPVSLPCPRGGSSCGGQCAIPFAFADVTGDGKPDLNPGIASMNIAVNGGNRTFAQPVTLWQGGGGTMGAQPGNGANVLADMNGDGKADLVSGGGFGSAPTVVLIDQAAHYSW